MACVEINAVRGAVGAAIGLDAADKINLFLDMVRGPAQDVRGEDVQRRDILPEGRGVFLGDLPGRHARAPRPLLHLVLTRIGVGDQVAHVGDIHHMPHVVAVVGQRAAQDVVKDIGAQVADMRVIVNRHAAGVEANPRWV